MCSDMLVRLTIDAGVILPKRLLVSMCKLSRRWTQRFTEMKSVRDGLCDHRRYSDEHEFRVHRRLTREPMEVLYGDVHAVDMSIKEA